MPQEEEKLRKIFPRNLTARAVHQVVGNPVSTRLESGAGNCFPGLEIDVRNLDRRFFPGLIFTFIDVQDYPPPYNDLQLQGAKLIYVDITDITLHWEQEESAKLHKELTGVKGTALKSGTWFLKSIEQQGKEISMYEYSEDGSKKPLSGLVVWRLIRCLKPGTIKIKLVSRNPDPKKNHTESEIELQGWRRLYVDPQTGVISEVYLVGELGQSLCAPWTHDFRDCSCQYWASNHPDIVYGAIAPSEETSPDGKSANPVKANILLDWLREDRSPAGAAAAKNTIPKNRPFQFDHYQINQRWEELNIVLQNHEIEEVYTPMGADSAPPFASSAEMVRGASRFCKSLK